MALLLLTLLLLSALPVSLGCDGYYINRGTFNDRCERFRLEHTYSQDAPVDCDRFMNHMLQRLNRRDCKVCNDIILGHHSNPTNYTDLREVCREKTGYRVKGIMYQSYHRFRVVTCWSVNEEISSPPNCRYASTYSQSPVRVFCEGRHPVYIPCC